MHKINCLSLKRLIVIATMLILTGCGFHLKGVLSLPSSFNPIAVVNQNNAIKQDLVDLLKHILINEHRIIVDDTTKANYLIILESDDFNQTLNNVAASTTPRQYQLTYILRAQVIHRNGSPLLPSSTISIQRQVTINNDRILGSNYELDTISKEMHQAAAMQLMIRINRTLSS